uniref:Sulfatase N-terminal domain-containing protein n=1 Tax=Chaetoceros debilis TaxID=122233 RepID=A0A7S3V7R5_9STRA
MRKPALRSCANSLTLSMISHATVLLLLTMVVVQATKCDESESRLGSDLLEEAFDSSSSSTRSLTTSCQNYPQFVLNAGNKNKLTCEIVHRAEEYLRYNFCQIEEVSTHCEIACGTCCANDRFFRIIIGDGRKKWCKWLESIADEEKIRRCQEYNNGRWVKEACAKACGDCKIEPAPQPIDCENDRSYRIVLNNRNGQKKNCIWLKSLSEADRNLWCRKMNNGQEVRKACSKSCGFCQDPPLDQPEGPNLVVVMTDEHNYRTLSAYRDFLVTKHGEAKTDVWGPDALISTPNIDSLAKDGAMLTNYYTAAPVCTPSRSSFMSGMYPHFTGSDTNNGAMNLDVTTFAQVLQEANYATSYVGKWHLDGNEIPGWDTNVGREFGFEENKYRFNRGHWKYFEDVPNSDRVQEYNYTNSDLFENRYEKHFSTDFLFDRGIDFIKNSVRKKEQFALFLSIPDPHAPNEVRPPYDNLYDETFFKVPTTGRSAMTKDPASPIWQVMDLADRGRPDDLDEMEEFLDAFEKSDWWQDYMRKYFGMVRCIDENIGKLLNSIKGSGIENNTILVFTSDHGDMLMEHGKIDKGSPFETSAGIPFLIRYPEKIPASKVIETPSSSVDFAPTILSLMGIQHGLHFQGKDAIEALVSDDLSPIDYDKVIFSADYSNGRWVMAMAGGFKLVIGRTGAPWLFDLHSDPEEITNFIESPFHEEIKAKLQNALVEAINSNLIKFDIGNGSFLDTPKCIDELDILPLSSNQKYLCSDIGTKTSSTKCDKQRKIQIHCPDTCNICNEDSEGRILLPDGVARTCKEMDDGQWCNKRGKKFCPITCAKEEKGSEDFI